MYNRIITAAFAVLLALAAATSGADPYDSDSWPGKTAASRDGLDLEAAGLEGVSVGKTYHRQPRGGTRHVLEKDGKPAADVTITVHDTASDAQKDLRRMLMTCTVRLDNAHAAGIAAGDVAFGRWTAEGGEIKSIGTLMFTRANVTVVIQNVPARLTAAEVKGMAEAVSKAIDARPSVGKASDLKKPELSVGAVAGTGEGAVPEAHLVVTAVDPRGLKLKIKHEEPGGVSCRRTGDTLYFTAEKPGEYAVRVTAINSLNLCTSREFKISR